MPDIRLNASNIEAFLNNGGITSSQLKLLGYNWPPPKGWKKDCINKKISLKIFNELIEIKNGRLQTHQAKKRNPRRKKKNSKNNKLKHKESLLRFVEVHKKMSYGEQLKHPNWQRMRLFVLQRDNFTCKLCKSKHNQLHVHHKTYFKGKYAWDINPIYLMTLCEHCHKKVHNKSS